MPKCFQVDLHQSRFNFPIGRTDEGLLLFNSASGELCILPRFLEEALSESTVQITPEKEFLVKKGYLTSSSDELSNILESMKEKRESDQSSEITIAIGITTACNYRCRYCFEKGLIPNSMSDICAEKLFEFIQAECGANEKLRMLRIVWFGGEPTLEYQNMINISHSIQDFCARRGIQYSGALITNGSLLDKWRISKLLDAGVRRIQITLDGLAKEHCRYKGAPKGSFERVLENLEETCPRMYTALRLNADSENFESILQLVSYAHKIDAIKENLDSIALAQIRYNDEKDTPDQHRDHLERCNLFCRRLAELEWINPLKSALPKVRKVPCGYFEKRTLLVDPLGYLYKCESHIGDEAKAFGSIVNKNFNNHSMRDYFCKYSLPEKCNRCEILPICFGGCPDRRIMGHDTIACDSLKEHYRSLFMLWFKLQMHPKAISQVK